MMSERRITVGNIEIKYHEDGSISFRQDDDFIKVRRDLLEMFREALFDENSLCNIVSLKQQPVLCDQCGHVIPNIIGPVTGLWFCSNACNNAFHGHP